jgi:uncharacterized protein (DUF736 family)
LELGAAWRAPAGGEVVLTVQIDDPAFAAPLSGALIARDATRFFLIWNRRKATANAA